MKLKYRIPTSLQHLLPQMMRYIALAGLILIVLAGVVQAMRPVSEYGENECQQIAIDYQKEFGGSLIWIQPIDEYGNPILCKYCAHVINKIWDRKTRTENYYDYGMNIWIAGNIKIELWDNKPVRVYDLSKERPEFGMKWYY